MSEIKEPLVESSNRFNLLTSIWIVPIIAFFVSFALLYRHYSALGPKIEIVLPNSDGLEAGQSVIKFRNLAVGKILKIHIQKEDKGVVVVARMDKDMKEFLNESTKFWIVKPRVGYSGVSGLDTLISGSYIAMYAKRQSSNTKRKFIGEMQPYRDKNSGIKIHMISSKLSTVKVGTPINYKNIQIGEIERISLSPNGKNIALTAFIKKRYKKLINDTTKFWVQSLASIKLQDNRLDIKFTPVISYLAFGGITFETKFDKNYPLSPKKHIFHLYDSSSDAKKQVESLKSKVVKKVIFKFAGRVSGLRKDSSIRYQGFNVGAIKNVDIHYDSLTHKMNAKAIGEIETSFFDDANKSGLENIKKAVEDGMRAKLVSSNPIFDSLYVDLVFLKDANSSKKTMLKISKDGTLYFPVIDSNGSELIGSILALTNRLDQTLNSYKKLADTNNKPLKQMLESIKKSSDAIKKFLPNDNNSSGGIMNKLNKAMSQLDKTLKTTRKVLNGYRSNSLFGKRVTDMLKEINKSSEETHRLLKKLNKKPNSLIFGD